MKAIILAGGFGTRLSSVVTDLPKPMAPCDGRPFLSYLLDDLQQQGISEVVMAVHHLKNKIIDYYGTSYEGIPLSYSEEFEPLGTGGAILKALDAYGEGEAVLCLNGDSFLEISLKNLMDMYKKKTYDLVMAVRPMDNCNRYGQVYIENGLITKFQYPGSSLPGYINSGVYVLSKKLFRKLNLKNSFSFEKAVLQNSFYKLNCGYVLSEGKFIDIGTPQSYKDLNIFFSSK